MCVEEAVAWDVFRREEGGGLGPKSVCTKNGPIRFSQWEIPFCPTMVTLVWGAVPPPCSYGVQPF